MTDTARIERRLAELEQIVARHGSALVAFSGGVDSSLALAVAARALPPENVLAVTSNNETYLPSELEPAKEFVASLGVEHLVVDTRELDNPDYASNPTNRCYFCKHELFTELVPLARAEKFACIVYGENASDVGDFRPGAQAAAEFQVRAPLKEAGLTKAEIRELSAQLATTTIPVIGGAA